MKVYILVDRSGSMQSRWDETLGAINAYVDTIKQDKKAASTTDVTVAAFDNEEPFKIIRSDVKVLKWNDVTKADAAPRGMTPLFDAIGKLSQKVNDDNPEKAAIVILTDGAENSSKEVDKATAKSYLDALRKKNFEVTFIGADFDSFGQGAGLGNSHGQTIIMNAGSYEHTFRGLAAKSMAYASTGVVMDFSDEDRKKASGK